MCYKRNKATLTPIYSYAGIGCYLLCFIVIFIYTYSCYRCSCFYVTGIKTYMKE